MTSFVLRRAATLVAAIVALAVWAPGALGDVHPQEVPYVPGEVLIRFEPGVSSQRQAQILEELCATLEERLWLHGLGLYGVPDVQGAVDAAGSYPEIDFAEPNSILSPSVVSDDPLFGLLWGLSNSSDTDIDGPEAWDIAKGTAAVDVAVIDTGVSYTHPDLLGNMWTNPGETPGNGIDDDDDGFVDNVYGADVYAGDGSPIESGPPTGGHGTHVAGTIGAVGDNAIGVTGVSWTTDLMAIRAGDVVSGFALADLVEAIGFADAKDAEVANMSLGGYFTAPGPASLSAAITAASDVLFVVAAGNDGFDLDTPGIDDYPCEFTAANLICVSATDSSDGPAGWGPNVGSISVDVAAPGTDILSTFPGGAYAYMSGTSMATPHVTGLAALLYGVDLSATPGEIKERILGGADVLGSWSGLNATSGRINAYGSLLLSPICGGLIPTIVGTPSSETITGTAGPDVIYGGAGADTIYGFGGADVECGNGGGDSLFGGGGADVLIGGAGGDTIAGGAGSDTEVGGAGSDLTSYASASAGVVVNLSTGVVTGQGTDSLVSIERATGSPYADSFTGSGAANVFYGGAGADSVSAAAGDDIAYGGAGDDFLTGGAGFDSAYGGLGFDTCSAETETACEA